MVGWHHGFMDMSLNKLWETVKDRKPGMMQFVGPQSVGHDSATEQQQQLRTVHQFCMYPLLADLSLHVILLEPPPLLGLKEDRTMLFLSSMKKG